MRFLPPGASPRPCVRALSLVLALLACACDEPWARHLIDGIGAGADGVRLAEVNGDGLPDLVVGWEEGGETRAYLSAGLFAGAPLWQAVRVGPAPDVEDAFFADLDGDGALDVVSLTEGATRHVLVHWSPRNAAHLLQPTSWSTASLLSGHCAWMYGQPLDLDGDGRLDLLIGGKGEGAEIGWLRAPADPRRAQDWSYHPIAAAGWVMSLLIEDMNDDGLPDLVVSDRFGPTAGVRWLRNPGHRAPSARSGWREHWVGARGRDVPFVAVADLDGDRRDEIVVPWSSFGQWGISVFERLAGEEWREHELDYPAVAGRPKAVAVGDVDLDGRLDLVLSATEAHDAREGIVWMRQAGSPFDPVWPAHVLSGLPGIKFDQSVLLDLDRDGDLDVLNTEELEAPSGTHVGLGVLWYENPFIP